MEVVACGEDGADGGKDDEVTGVKPLSVARRRGGGGIVPSTTIPARTMSKMPIVIMCRPAKAVSLSIRISDHLAAQADAAASSVRRIHQGGEGKLTGDSLQLPRVEG